MTKVIQLENAVRISSEMATYLEMYLKGDMFTSEKEAKQNIDKQITHAQEIKKVCERIPF